ncbi:MAG: GntR family transcriptional regulator [Terriglobales bacterium]
MTRQAYRRIRDGILSGEMGGDHRLSEQVLAQALGISKSPIREALNQLEVEGLIRIQPRRGAFVRTFSLRDVEEIYDVRAALECHLMRSVRLSPAHNARLHRLLDDARRYFRAQDGPRYVRADVAFHGLLAHCGDNGRLQQILDRMCGQLLLLRRRTYSLTGERSAQEHHQILQALEAGDNRKAERLMAHHIGRVRGALLETMRGNGTAAR